MVLGSIYKNITYPQSLYYSAKGYGFGYIPKALTIEPGGWDVNSNKFLASIFGLKHEMSRSENIICRATDRVGECENRKWNAYVMRIWNALKEGSAVQVCKAWKEGIETPPWWEGMTVRPDIHYVTVVGMDKSKNIIYIHDPIGGWYGTGKYMPMAIGEFRDFIEETPLPHRYITITFKKIRTIYNYNTIEERVKDRIIKKINGDPVVYDFLEIWQEFFDNPQFKGFEYGIKGLEAFKRDLEPDTFKELLRKSKKSKGIEPLDIVSYINLNIYHYSFITSISAEYLEEKRRIKEWEWLFNLHLFYEILWVSTTHIRDIFKNNNNLDEAVKKSEPYLLEMKITIDDMIKHFKNYLRLRPSPRIGFVIEKGKR